MRIAELVALYALVGAGCAALVLKRRGIGPVQAGEAVLAFGLWPLYGPFLLLEHEEGGATETDDERRFLQVLEHLGGTPLAALLPDRETVRLLSRRLRLASDRLGEIDRLLATPEFSEEEARGRVHGHRANGDERAAVVALSRADNIVRMRHLRDRFRGDIAQIRELLGQLRVQAEVVRLSGAADGGTRELVGEIVARVEGLDSVLAEGVPARA
jgi:hypothetical protein